MPIFCNIVFPNSPGSVKMAVTTAGAGNGLTLQPLVPNAINQLFEIVGNSGGQGGGVAFLQYYNGQPYSVTSQGTQQQVVMEPFQLYDTDQDCWFISQANNGVRIFSTTQLGWSWNDFGGGYNAGDIVAIWNDQGGNSVLQLTNFSGSSV